MPIQRPKTNGSVVVRRYLPPQIETEASIKNGELSEELGEVGRRIGLEDSEEEPIMIVNEQGLCIMSKMFENKTYYLSGGKLLDAGDKASPSTENTYPPDAAVLWAYDERVLLHEPSGHRSPETPYRLQRAMEMLENSQRANLMFPWQLAPDSLSEGNMAKYCDPRFATLDEICAFHDIKKYRHFVENGEVIQNLKSDVYCNPKTSSDAARISAGAVIDVGLTLLQNRSRICCGEIEGEFLKIPTSGFCLVRPPGHHCSCDTPSGFCLINNVAVASTAILQRKFVFDKGSNPRTPKIAIIDLDVHFGEGTASFVDEYYHDQKSDFPLMYLSLHRFDNGAFYPFLSEGSSEYVGRHHKGFVRNVAVHTNGHTPSKCHEIISDTLVDKVMRTIFLPYLSEFNPDIVFVSLGFDAAYGDPLGKMAVEGGFSRSVLQLKKWCSDRSRVGRNPVALAVVLEGGYNPEAVSTGILSVAHALTFPEEDQEVQKFSKIFIPKIWGDLRKRQERRRRENEAGGNIEVVESVADDQSLAEKHEVWCDAVVRKVRDFHRLALGI